MNCGRVSVLNSEPRPISSLRINTAAFTPGPSPKGRGETSQNSNSIRSSPKMVLGKMARATSSPMGSSDVESGLKWTNTRRFAPARWATWATGVV